MIRLRAEREARLIDLLLEEGLKRKTANAKIREGAVSVNDRAVMRATHVVRAGDVVVVGRAAPSLSLPFGMKLLKQHAGLIAVDKPHGLLSVPNARGDRSAQTGLETHLKQKLFRVHRLDRETSGVLLFAKDKSAQVDLTRAWGSAQKVYLAVVRDGPRDERGLIDLPLRELPSRAVIVDEKMRGARDARTRFVVERRAGPLALLRLELETGRKHQIRVHLAHIGCPVVDDRRYDPNAGTGRMLLHARRLSVLEHTFEAELPRGFLPGALK